MENMQIVEVDEAPLSPVLTTSKVNKKLLQSKRKSRVNVKLCSKFNENTQLNTIKEQEVSDSSSGDIKDAFLDKGDCSQSRKKYVGESVGEKVQKFQEFEENFDRFYEELSSVQKTSMQFKIPCNPIPKINNKSAAKTEVPDVDFKTAAGKGVPTDGNSLKNPLQIFTDIKVDTTDSNKIPKMPVISEGDELLSADLKTFEDISDKSFVTTSDTDVQNAEYSGSVSSVMSKNSSLLDEASEAKAVEKQKPALRNCSNSTDVSENKILEPEKMPSNSFCQNSACENEITDSQMMEVARCVEMVNEAACEWNLEDLPEKEQTSDVCKADDSFAESDCSSVPSGGFKGFEKHEIIATTIDLLIDEYIKENSLKAVDENEENRRFKGFDKCEIVSINKTFCQFESKMRRCIAAMSQEIKNNRNLFLNDSDTNLDQLLQELNAEFERKSKNYEALFNSRIDRRKTVETVGRACAPESEFVDANKSKVQNTEKGLSAESDAELMQNELTAAAKALEETVSNHKKPGGDTMLLRSDANRTNKLFVADFTTQEHFDYERSEQHHLFKTSNQNLQIGFKSGCLDFTDENDASSNNNKKRTSSGGGASEQENSSFEAMESIVDDPKKVIRKSRNNTSINICAATANQRSPIVGTDDKTTNDLEVPEIAFQLHAQRRNVKRVKTSTKRRNASAKSSFDAQNATSSPVKSSRESTKSLIKISAVNDRPSATFSHKKALKVLRKRSNSIETKKAASSTPPHFKRCRSEPSSPILLSPKFQQNVTADLHSVNASGVNSAAQKTTKTKSPAKKKCKDISENDPQSNAVALAHNVRFSSAAGKSINVSVEPDIKIDYTDVDSKLCPVSSLNVRKRLSAAVNDNSAVPSCSHASDFKVLKESSKQVIAKNFNSSIKTTGLSSSSGKPVRVSKEGPSKALTKFEEVDENTPGKACGGFSTAPGKNTKVSKEKLKKAQSTFDDIDPNAAEQSLGKLENENLNKKSDYEHKLVKVYKERLAKASTTFEEVDQNTPGKACGGFSTASGKNIKISKEKLKKAQSVFDDIDVINEAEQSPGKMENDKLNKQIDYGRSAFTTASRNKPNVSKIPTGFSTASGKGLGVSRENFVKANAMKEKIEADLLAEESVTSKTTASNSDRVVKMSSVSKSAKQKHTASKSENSSYSEENVDAGLLTAGRKTISVSERSKERAKDIFSDLENTLNDDSLLESVLQVEKADSMLQQICKINNKSVGVDSSSPPRKKQKTALEASFDEHQENSCARKLGNSSKQQSPSPPKKRSKPRLGVNRKRSLGPQLCQPIKLSETQLTKARNLFDDIDFSDSSFISSPGVSGDNTSVTSQNSSSCTPEKAHSVPLQSSTPNTAHKKQRSAARNQPFAIETNLTPIKEIPEPSDHSESTQLSEYSARCRKRKKDQIVFQQNACSNIVDWERHSKNVFDKMKHRLSILESRIEAIKYQKDLIHEGSREHRRQHAGRLFRLKTNSASRVSLRQVASDFPECRDEEDAKLFEIRPELLDVTPRSALDVHFYSPWLSSKSTHRSKDDLPVLSCNDGAVVIPSSDDMIGFLEIDCAFRSMQGVDPTLIPDGWVQNHFKWIVWKFAGMERTMPHTFKGVLCADNILQQLKYRYDREIDRVERSALRKILEKDDVPGKRLVLCVSAIVQTSANNYELDLTDGWYEIRTVIDYPLMQQVHKKIKLGTKLLICGAELLNCDGCSPLEVPASVKLKINFNSTRRVKWDTKLGYQRIPTPFPTCLNSANLEGGIVRCVKCYVARVYPLKFKENMKNGGTIWRNARAENKRCAVWESEKERKVEMVHAKVREQMEAKERQNTARRYSGKSIRQMSLAEIQKINCPQTLFEMMERTSDPDSFRERLTSSQHEALIKYQSEGLLNKQQELSAMIKERINKDNLTRDVCAVLKVLIFDWNCLRSDCGTVLTIWRPKPDLLNDVVEGSVAYIYNILPKTSSNFSSMSKTRFEIIKSDPNKSISEFGSRRLTKIADVLVRKFSPSFGEFDTVGVIVKVNIEVTGQDLWLVDSNYKFLHIKIAEGPQTCSLLDRLQCGKCVAVSNLIHRGAERYFGKAFADHYTIVSYYPNEAYLKEGLDDLSAQLPKDINYLEDCTTRIVTLEMMLKQADKNLSIINPLRNVHAQDSFTDNSIADDVSFSDEGTLLMSKLTDDDVAMSLIDTQQFR